MKTLIISLFLLLIAASTWAQVSNDTIVVAPGPSGMYFYHIVQKGENLQSLSKKFGVRPGQLASINNKESLDPYELIKIPLNKTNIIQTGRASAHATLKPLYHKVLKGETLFRVGKLYGDISLSSLREWNDLQDNTIDVGQYLIVGWLQENPVVIAGKTSPVSEPANAPSANTAPGTENEPARDQSAEGNLFLREVIAAEKQRVKQVSQKLQADKPVANPLLTTAPDIHQQSRDMPQPVSKPLLTTSDNISNKKEPQVASTSAPANEQSKIAVAQPHSTPPSPKTGTANTANPFEKMLNQITGKNQKQKEEKPNVTPNESPQKAATPVAKKEEKPVLPVTATTTAVPSPSDAPLNKNKDTATLTLSRESLFSELYLAQTQGEKLVNNKKGAAGWFKSNVKPGSKKYYALCDNLPRGTIVKVINPINNKFVYVKVLAPIPKQKENYNLIIKLSDAAMNDLGTNQPRFWSKIVYPQLNENTAN